MFIKKRKEKVRRRSGGKAKEEVFLIHRSLWNAGRMPSIACWNSFFLFSLKELALFSLEIFSERDRERERAGE